MRQQLVLQPKPGELFLNLEFQKFDQTILFHDDSPTPELINGEFVTAGTISKQIKRDSNRREDAIIDGELGKENPFAKIHRKFKMHVQNAFLDRFLEPDSSDRKELIKIIEKTALEDIKPDEKTV
jgi:hypothetical protein